MSTRKPSESETFSLSCLSSQSEFQEQKVYSSTALPNKFQQNPVNSELEEGWMECEDFSNSISTFSPLDVDLTEELKLGHADIRCAQYEHNYFGGDYRDLGHKVFFQ